MSRVSQWLPIWFRRESRRLKGSGGACFLAAHSPARGRGGEKREGGQIPEMGMKCCCFVKAHNKMDTAIGWKAGDKKRKQYRQLYVFHAELCFPSSDAKKKNVRRFLEIN